MKKFTTSERLKEYMSKYNVKQVDILERAKPYTLEHGVKLNKNDLSQYVSGRVEPGQDKIFILSKALNVDPAWIMGLDVPMRKKPTKLHDKHSNAIPLVGTIAAGQPLLAEENIEDYFNIDTSIKADFALRIKGDSMIGAGIFQNDIVFIKQQCDLENGEIGAVLIEDSATLKKFHRKDNTIILQSENDMYEPMIFTNGNIKILGKLVAVLNIRG
ncbi:transcriptional repressor LexA [Tissierella creatinophila]|uniref:LexA repressor n=1 Tax=Tissierella creatinophila DSM 6911 TaxID=1123403 RepID=A0A1U7M552_TISCR|nr:transcriptional repressor LexA [Tissierella creatinophila]OLS02437.1 LexA repressor [Tissierella creatinophila DSM 6911]